MATPLQQALSKFPLNLFTDFKYEGSGKANEKGYAYGFSFGFGKDSSGEPDYNVISISLYVTYFVDPSGKLHEVNVNGDLKYNPDYSPEKLLPVASGEINGLKYACTLIHSDSGPWPIGSIGVKDFGNTTNGSELTFGISESPNTNSVFKWDLYLVVTGSTPNESQMYLVGSGLIPDKMRS